MVDRSDRHARRRSSPRGDRTTCTTPADALTPSPFMPVFGPPQRACSCAGSGTELWDADGNALPRLPVRARGHVARPRQPGGHRGDRRPGGDAAPREQLLRQPAGDRGGDVASTSCCADATGVPRARSFFCNSGAEADECAHQARPQVRRPRPPRRRQRARQLPRAHARHARGHRPAGQARAVPPDARGLPPRRLRRPRRAARPPSTRRSPPCSSSRSRARAASTRRRPATCAAIRAAVRRAGALMMVDEVQTGLRPHRPVVRLRARRRRARRRDDGQGAGQRLARRRVLGPRRRRRGVPARRPRQHLQRHGASPRRRSTRSSPRCAASTRRRSPRSRATACAVGAPRRSPASPRSAARAAARRRARHGLDATAVYRSLLDRGLVTNAVTPTALRFAPPLTVSDAEIDEAVRSSTPF